MLGKLTENQTTLLKTALLREDRCFALPSNLKGGAAKKVAAKLIAAGLAREIKAKVGSPISRYDGEGDQAYSLKLTAAAIKAIATIKERREMPAQTATKQAVSPEPMGSSKACDQAAEVSEASPREGSKLARVIALLRRSEGATIEALTKATGWLPHTTRAAITGVRKRGYSVILDRREEGASVYRLSDPRESEAETSAPQMAEDNKPAHRKSESKVKAAA